MKKLWDKIPTRSVGISTNTKLQYIGVWLSLTALSVIVLSLYKIKMVYDKITRKV